MCGEDAWQILDLVTHLRDAYCSSLAVEMDHLSRCSICMQSLHSALDSILPEVQVLGGGRACIALFKIDACNSSRSKKA